MLFSSRRIKYAFRIHLFEIIFFPNFSLFSRSGRKSLMQKSGIQMNKQLNGNENRQFVRIEEKTFDTCDCL